MCATDHNKLTAPLYQWSKADFVILVRNQPYSGCWLYINTCLVLNVIYKLLSRMNVLFKTDFRKWSRYFADVSTKTFIINNVVEFHSIGGLKFNNIILVTLRSVFLYLCVINYGWEKS